MHKVTFIPGDGTGPDVAWAMRRCVDATGVQIEWEEQHAGVDVMEEKGTPLPPEVLESVRRNKVAIKGPITTPVGKGFRSVNVALRKELDLYACLRPCKFYPGVRSHYPEVDLVIVRENTEDLYAGIEFQEGTEACLKAIDVIEELSGAKIKRDSGVSIKPISISGTRRIVRWAFEYAKANGRRKVTAVHKANIMKFSDGLYLQTAREVAEEYADSGIEFEDRIVDNMCMQLVQKPELYDVLVLPNLYGDILSDLACGLVGGLGVAPGANMGDGIAVFEPTHGSAPKYVGQNRVNPVATILSGVLMLRHLGETDAAERLEAAVSRVMAEGVSVTYDLKPERDDPSAVGTNEMAEAIIAAI
jgi:isocitrate dehydrogenase (NAD+)